MNHLIACSCGEVLIKSSNGETKIRGKIIVFRGSEAVTICKGCGAEAIIPVTLDVDALQKSCCTHPPRLFVSKSGRSANS